MTDPDTSGQDAERHMFDVRETARREAFRLARDTGAPIITRPMYRRGSEPAVRDIEPLAGARAARDLEAAARGTARDYIRRAREAAHGWERIGDALGLGPGSGAGQDSATAPDGAYDYAAGPTDTHAPWRPRLFGWTCPSCDHTISDRGLIQGPADDELGHAETCPRLATATTEWDAESAHWAAELEDGH